MICQHIAVEDLLQLFALFVVSNIPLVRFQQFCSIFLTEIRCVQCLQITGIHLKHIFVSLFAGILVHHHKTYMHINFQQNQVKTQVMTVPTRYQITAKRNYRHRRMARRTDGQTNVHGRTDTHRRTNRWTNGRTDRHRE